MQASNIPNSSFRDPLAYLPHRPVLECSKDSVIYDGQTAWDRLYVLLTGRVKVTRTSGDGSQTVMKILGPEGIFGESAFIPAVQHTEAAVALDTPTRFMAWPIPELLQLIERDPRLGMALSHYMVRKSLDLQDRIESASMYRTPERVMLALLQIAGEIGTPLPDGSTRFTALTHHIIAEYVGTSREIVTFQMNRLRRLALLRYTRKHIDVFTQAMKEQLANGAVQPRKRTFDLTVAAQ
jgi:CRP/FNR family transcriptional regulator